VIHPSKNAPQNRGSWTWLLYPADLRRVARVTTVRDFIIELIDAWSPLLLGV
jgi:hypothetical protein